MISFGLLESCLFRLVAAAGSVAWYPVLVHPSLGVTRETAVFMCAGSRMRPALGSPSGGLMSPSTCLPAHTLFRRRAAYLSCAAPPVLRRSGERHPFPPALPASDARASTQHALRSPLLPPPPNRHRSHSSSASLSMSLSLSHILIARPPLSHSVRCTSSTLLPPPPLSLSALIN